MPVFSLGTKLKNLFNKDTLSDIFFDDLEDLLIESDIGVRTVMEITRALKERKSKLKSEKDLLQELKSTLSEDILSIKLQPLKGSLNLFLVLGVNGVGKTTSIAKMADYYKKNLKIDSILSAGDTFRAAAIEQLVYHGEKLNMKVIKQKTGSDPGAVIYDTIESAKAGGNKLVIADTAGRMHNRANLVRELQKIDKIIVSKIEKDHYKKIIVIDATTGQNGLRQAELFHEAIHLDAVILAKYDSMSKGGIIIPICKDLKIPIAFIGTGEKYEDFEPFDKDTYLNNLLGLE